MNNNSLMKERDDNIQLTNLYERLAEKYEDKAARELTITQSVYSDKAKMYRLWAQIARDTVSRITKTLESVAKLRDEQAEEAGK